MSAYPTLLHPSIHSPVCVLPREVPESDRSGGKRTHKRGGRLPDFAGYSSVIPLGYKISWVLCRARAVNLSSNFRVFKMPSLGRRGILSPIRGGQTMAWTDERVELLKKLWTEGLSASQIAGRLGGVTRNAVIGKVHRLGLSGRATTNRMASQRRVRSYRRRRIRQGIDYHPWQLTLPLDEPQSRNDDNILPFPKQPFIDRMAEVKAPASLRMTILVEKDGVMVANDEFTSRNCKWSTGRDQRGFHEFCGTDTIPGTSYCYAHLKASRDPLPPRPISLPGLISGTLPRAALTYGRILDPEAAA